MKKNSNANTNKRGASKFIPSTIFTNGPVIGDNKDDNSTLFPDYFISEKEKLEDDKKALKKVFNYHESLARTIVNNKRDEYEQNYKLAYGFINPIDYGLEDNEEYNKELDVLAQGTETTTDFSETIKLEYFPIIPNMVNTLKQELVRKYYNLFPKLVDSESINEYVTAKQDEARNFLISKKLEEFQAKLDPTIKNNPEEYQKSLDEFSKLPEIEKYYSTEYKPEIVKWAECVLERDDLKFDFTTISKDVFEDQIVQAERFLHIRDTGVDYEPEYLYPADCAYIVSPLQRCVSQSVWFHWFEEITIQGLITKYGDKLDDETVEKIKCDRTARTEFAIDDSNWVNHKWNNKESVKNYFAIKNIMEGSVGIDSDHVRLSHQYFILPRKVALLTIRIKSDDLLSYEDVFSDYIDPEEYEIQREPVYKTDSDKTLENLIEGEHLDKFFINEVWYAVKVDNGYNSSNGYTSDKDFDDNKAVWIEIKKLDYQGKPENQLFGTVIPVFGGKTNFKSGRFNKSVVKSCAPYQVYHNYLMNKIKELVITELMPFHIINQGAVGASSAEESWKTNPLLKFIQSGQDTGLSVADSDGFGQMIMNGQPISQAINLDRSIAIKTRWELAQIMKNECLAQIGLTPQLLGDVKPQETATGVTEGINRSIIQIQHLYDDHYALIRRAKQYMVELAQIKAFKRGGMIEMSYINSDLQNVIFSMDSKNLPLTRSIGLFMVDDAKSNEVLEKMRMLAMQDNTMGADGYEKLLIMRAKSDASLLEQLRQQKLAREKRESQQMQQNQMMQQEALQSQQEAQIAKQNFEAQENALDREVKLIEAQLKALGQSKTPDSDGDGQFDATQILSYNNENQKIANDLSVKTEQIILQREKQRQELQIKQQELQQKQLANANEYSAKMKQIDIDLKKMQIQLQIAKENKNKFDK